MQTAPGPNDVAQVPGGDAPAGSISIAVDRKLGFVRLVSQGFYSPEYIRAHFRKLERVLMDMRRETPRIRALVDLTKASVQSPDSAEQIKISTARMHRAVDEVVILQKSALMAMQMRRVVGNENCVIVSSIEEASACLKLDLNSVDCSIVQ